MIAAAVVGRGGLLGRAVVRELGRRPHWRESTPRPAPWRGGTDAVREWARALGDGLVEETGDGPWVLIWSAGAAVTASSTADVDEEAAIVEAALDGLRGPLSAAGSRGAVFVASSAGGVYAGSVGAPFTEESTPRPISPYGELKLRTESMLTAFAAEMGAASLVGRIANLYGPGQRIDKPQGLISQMAMARVTPRLASIYVPLDTLRDYLYVDDCARLVLDAMERLQVERGAVTKILATGDPTSIAALLGYFRTVTKGRPRVVLGASELGVRQALDLRFRSTIWPDLDARAIRTTLPEGIAATVLDIERAVLDPRRS